MAKLSFTKTVVTGGAGFIGTNLLRFLKTKYPKARFVSFDIASPIFPVSGVDYIHGDIRSYFHLKKIIRRSDKVFHLASELGTHESFLNPDTINEVNIEGTQNLLELAKEHDFFLFVASKPNVWLNPYSISKDCAEKYVQMYVKEFGVKAVILKWFSVYGPYQYVYKYQKAVPFFICQALGNKPLFIYGNGEQEGDFIYVEDAVRAADLAIERKLFGEIIEFGFGKGIKINDLAKKIIELSNSKSAIKHLPMRRGETPNSKIFANTEKMKKLLQFSPRVNLEQGLKKTIDFYRNHLENRLY